MKKFNILDIIIVLVIVLCIAGVAFRFTSESGTKTNASKNFDYVVKIESVRMFSVEALQKSAETQSEIVDTESETVCGRVYKIDYRPAKEAMALSDGTVKWVDVADRYDVYLYARTSGRVNQQGYKAENSRDVMIGKESYFTTQWSGFMGIIADVGENLENNVYTE